MTFVVTPVKNNVPSTDKTQPVKPENKAKSTDKQVVQPKVQQKVQPKVNAKQDTPKVVKDSSELTKLPQTGETDDKAATATGLAMIGSLLGMFGLKNRKRKRDEK